jgi:hypothetical protein
MIYLVNAYPKVCTVYVGQYDCTFGAVISLLLLRSAGLDVLCVLAPRLVLSQQQHIVNGREVVEYTSSILTKK